MKLQSIKQRLCALSAAILLSSPLVAGAAQPKTYQVTGPVLELTNDLIVVQKGKEKWEIGRSPEMKVTGELKVGAKVTIEYRMTAASVEVKGAPAKAAAPAKPAPAAEKAAAAAQ